MQEVPGMVQRHDDHDQTADDVNAVNTVFHLIVIANRLVSPTALPARLSVIGYFKVKIFPVRLDEPPAETNLLRFGGSAG